MIVLAQRLFLVRFKDLDKWQVPRVGLIPATLPKGWRVVRVGDFARQVTDRVRVEPDKQYKMLGVRWYGEGVFLRETVKGDSMSATWVTPAKPGAFIYNRLFAWKESFAVVPPEFSGCFVSGEFPQFTLDAVQVSAEYLDLLFRLRSVIRAVNAASAGSAAVSRNRFKENEFLRMELPLPPLETQRAILAEWRKAKARIASAQERIGGIEAEIEEQFFADLGITPPRAKNRPRLIIARWKDMVRWSVGSMVDALLGLAEVPASVYEYTLLGSLAAVSYGIQKCPGNRPAQHSRPYLRVANVRKGFLDLTEIKQIEVPDSELPTYRLEAGDILFVEGNGSRAELGRVAKWSGEISDCVHQNHLIRVRCIQARLLPDFAVTWFNTEVGRGHFFRSAKTSSGLGTINSNEVRNAPIPVPPVNVQRRIMDRVEAGRARIAHERETAHETARCIEADLEAWLLGKK